MRGAFVRFHRWAGLAIAAFLIVTGLTGSVIAFYHELDAWLNPELFQVRSRGDPISPLELAARFAAQEPRRRVSYVPLTVEPGQALVLGLTGRYDAAASQSTDARYYEVFIDPVSGATLGERQWGACCFERRQLLPFLYSVHYSLHMPEVWGMRILGAVAIIWIVDCFVGFYLTLPGRSGSFWRRWKPAWQVKWTANPYRVNFDLHRATGLWLWAVLLTLAVSGVYLTLRYEVFRPAVALMLPVSPDFFEQPTADAAAFANDPEMSYAAIVDAATSEARKRGWNAPYDVFHSPEFGVYGVGFGDHHAAGLGVPYLYFDGATGRVLHEVVPGQGAAGDVFMQWLFPLHTGRIAGWPGRLLMSFSGLAVAVLSVTGVAIWAKRQRGRRLRPPHARNEHAA